jgi:hypothetical protein
MDDMFATLYTEHRTIIENAWSVAPSKNGQDGSNDYGTSVGWTKRGLFGWWKTSSKLIAFHMRTRGMDAFSKNLPML